MKTHYEKLGVSPTATAEEIKRAYRQKAAETHPDKGGRDKEFAEIGKAYETLKNPERRLLYDATGQDNRPPIEVEVQNTLLAAFNSALSQQGDIEILAFVRKGFDQYLTEFPAQIEELNKKRNKLAVKREKITAKGVNLVHQLIDAEIQRIDAGISQMEHQRDLSIKCKEALECYEEDWEEPKPLPSPWSSSIVMDFGSGTVYRHT